MPTLKAGKTQGGPVFLLRMPVWLRPKRSTARNGFCTCGWCHMLNPQTSSMTPNAFLNSCTIFLCKSARSSIGKWYFLYGNQAGTATACHFATKAAWTERKPLFNVNRDRTGIVLVIVFVSSPGHTQDSTHPWKDTSFFLDFHCAPVLFVPDWPVLLIYCLLLPPIACLLLPGNKSYWVFTELMNTWFCAINK